MIEKIRTKIKELSPGLRFVVRVAYPITLYIFFHFIIFRIAGLELRITQFVFILIWGLIEWQLFLKKD